MLVKTLFVRMKTNLLYDRASFHIRQSVGETFAGQAIDEYINGEKRAEFTYPRLQFKVLQGDPCIVAIGDDATEALREIIPDLEELEISGIAYKVVEKEVVDEEVEIGPSRTFINYQFITPWIGLNEENFLQFKYYYKQERTAFINRLIVQNLRFLSQEFGIPTDSKISIKSRIRFLTNQSLTSSPTGGFVGEFKINYNIPDFISIGNMIAKGFGAIKRVVV